MIIYYDINMQLNRMPGHLCESTIGKEYIGQGKVTNVYISDKLQYPRYLMRSLQRSIQTMQRASHSTHSEGPQLVLLLMVVIILIKVLMILILILGASALQMQQHFGWKNVAMAQEYMSTSKTAIRDVAAKLASNEVEEEPKVFRYQMFDLSVICNIRLVMRSSQMKQGKRSRR